MRFLISLEVSFMAVSKQMLRISHRAPLKTMNLLRHGKKPFKDLMNTIYLQSSMVLKSLLQSLLDKQSQNQDHVQALETQLDIWVQESQSLLTLLTSSQQLAKTSCFTVSKSLIQLIRVSLLTMQVRNLILEFILGKQQLS